MSAINVIRQRNAVHIISDAAVYDSDGVVQFFQPKAFSLPHLPAVLASRGPFRAGYLLGSALGAIFATFDDLVDGIEERLPEICEVFEDSLHDGHKDNIELYIVGWSAEREGPETYFLQTKTNSFHTDYVPPSGDYYVNPAPFELVKLPEIVLGPFVTQDEAKASQASLNRDVRGPGDLDPAVDGLRILEMQRQQRCTMGEVEAHWIGGFGLLSTVTKDGVTQRVIGRWDDEVGELIEPAPIDWQAWNEAHPLKSPAPPPGLSRLQRERMEKKIRKGTLRAVA
jgi:hypothetical protein